MVIMLFILGAKKWVEGLRKMDFGLNDKRKKGSIIKNGDL